jgi:hypothetical protein
MVLDQAALSNFNTSYTTARSVWIDAVVNAAANPAQAHTVGPAKAQVDSVLNAWRSAVDSARTGSEAATANSTLIDELSVLSSQVAKERETLRQLQSKQVTSKYQVGSVNPKITQSPYVNILGLRRNFRQSTRVGLIVASSIFGVLALGMLGYAGYASVAP